MLPNEGIKSNFRIIHEEIYWAVIFAMKNDTLTNTHSAQGSFSNQLTRHSFSEKLSCENFSTTMPFDGVSPASAIFVYVG